MNFLAWVLVAVVIIYPFCNNVNLRPIAQWAAPNQTEVNIQGWDQFPCWAHHAESAFQDRVRSLVTKAQFIWMVMWISIFFLLQCDWIQIYIQMNLSKNSECNIFQHRISMEKDNRTLSGDQTPASSISLCRWTSAIAADAQLALQIKTVVVCTNLMDTKYASLEEVLCATKFKSTTNFERCLYLNIWEWLKTLYIYSPKTDA